MPRTASFRTSLSGRRVEALKSHGTTEVELIMLPDKSHNIGDGFPKAELYAWRLMHSRALEGK